MPTVTSGPVPGDPDVTEPRDHELWEAHAGWWIDGFTEGADPEYVEQILPLAAAELTGFARVLDLGCGDGQISRLLAAAGASAVVGVDPTWNQIRVAHERGGGAVFARSEAAELPFPDTSFDAVVACLVFEHIDDVDGAIADHPSMPDYVFRAREIDDLIAYLESLQAEERTP